VYCDLVVLLFKEFTSLYWMLKKSIHGLFQLGKTKMRFFLSSIFNDFKSLKMAARPCAATGCRKTGVFRQPPLWKRETPLSSFFFGRDGGTLSIFFSPL